MKKSILTMLAGLLIVPVIALGVPAATAYAECDPTNTSSITNGADCAKSDDQTDDLFGDNGIFKTITNTALFIIGALSVIMLIYGGIRYTISMGDSKNVEAAKNTIMYAIIGIVVALLAAAIVNFVLGALVKTAQLSFAFNKISAVDSVDIFYLGYKMTNKIRPILQGRIFIQNLIIESGSFQLPLGGSC